MKTKTLFVMISFFLVFRLMAAQEDVLLPKPQKYKLLNESFALDKVKLSTPVMEKEWNDFIGEAKGVVDSTASKMIEVRIVKSIDEAKANPNEAYRLTVSKCKITVEAVTEQGIYRAIQTLGQLRTTHREKSLIRGCEITDWPAFRIRGFMHDVGRSYVSIEELKREIRLLSKFKINVFHWHLSENQSWRLQSKIFPMLNDSVNTTRFPGKYYTLEEARELVDYCKAHHMMLIPEFDMPGHSEAFVRTFRHDMQSPEGMKILKLLMEEICRTFDVPYLHIGTDEVKFTNPLFAPEMVAFIRSQGKKVISWNPGWHYKEGEIDMIHLWSSRGKPQKGIPAIDSRYHYANHFDTFGDLIALYCSRIGEQDQENDEIAGSILAFWNDRKLSTERDIIIQNQLYPSVLALAERAWLGGGFEYFDQEGTIFRSRNTERFRAFADFERRLLWHKGHTLVNEPIAYVRQTDMEWAITDPFPNGGDPGKVFPPEEQLADRYTHEGKTFDVGRAIGAGIYLRHVWGAHPTPFFKEPKENHTAYAYTYIYSPRPQSVGAWIEFQNYSRSEKDLPPPVGKWDYKGSRLWINDQEIEPPVWSAVHRKKSNEIDLGNENCSARPPTIVRLEKGWNKVLIKLPIGKFRSSEIRLVKWMFTFAPVTPDGQNGIEGLVYSPDRKNK